MLEEVVEFGDELWKMAKAQETSIQSPGWSGCCSIDRSVGQHCTLAVEP